MTDVSARALQTLNQRFGHKAFCPGQDRIIEAVLQGQDVLVVMPTGSGKSLCYQLPALMREGCTIVISPLIALMKDQVDSLQAQNIEATYINSSLSGQEQFERLQACRSGAYKLLYVAPERFRNARFLSAVGQMNVSLFAVDEAHCISEWGHDFRPDYLRLREAVEHLNQPQVVALTATATVDVQSDIVQQLGCADMQRFVTGFNRNNLTYRVQAQHAIAAKLQLLKELLAAQDGGSVIIYAATRRAVEEVASALSTWGADVLIYHAGLSDAMRRRTQEAFMARSCSIIVATNAFGMGVDKSDVRSVIHFNLPRTIEAYYQEAGRAGRDGEPAECVVLFSFSDVKIQEFLLEQSYPDRSYIEDVYAQIVALSRRQAEVPWQHLLPYRSHGSSAMMLDATVKILEKAGYVERVAQYGGDDAANPMIRLVTEPVVLSQLEIDYGALQRRKRHESQKLRHVVRYVNTRRCRRHHILSYFGEPWELPNCGSCDRCLDTEAAAARPQREPDEAEWVLIQKILSCIARMQGRYGRVKVVQVLMGSRAKDIRDTHLARLSTYGILKGTSKEVIDRYLEALLDADCVEVVGEDYPKLELTRLGGAVMRRQQMVHLPCNARSTSAPPPPSVPKLTPTVVKTSDLGAPSPGISADMPTEPDADLYERLRAQRTALARAESVPPYTVFHDRTLRELAMWQPTDRDSLLQIRGIGPAKADKYGDIFLDLIREHNAS
ncbi:recombinase RecQ [Candidatus Entotheonella serta]|nr:recombinase RecQ [Candidatus Entotheonella serta]